MKILLIGPQGSGKSTQADLLAQFLSLPKITVGDIFRSIAKEDSEEGKRIRQILEEGKLVDDQTTSEIVKKKLGESIYDSGFIMDGYPRTVEQMQLFDPGFDKVFYLDVPEEEVIKRLMARGREDDTAELVKTRLDLYYKETQPLLDSYQKQGKLSNIEGTGSVDSIQEEIRKQV